MLADDPWKPKWNCDWCICIHVHDGTMKVAQNTNLILNVAAMFWVLLLRLTRMKHLLNILRLCFSLLTWNKKSSKFSSVVFSCSLLPLCGQWWSHHGGFLLINVWLESESNGSNAAVFWDQIGTQLALETEALMMHLGLNWLLTENSWTCNLITGWEQSDKLLQGRRMNSWCLKVIKGLCHMHGEERWSSIPGELVRVGESLLSVCPLSLSLSQNNHWLTDFTLPLNLFICALVSLGRKIQYSAPSSSVTPQRIALHVLEKLSPTFLRSIYNCIFPPLSYCYLLVHHKQGSLFCCNPLSYV